MRHVTRSSIIGCTVALVTAVVPLRAQQPTTTAIRGVVRDTLGRPVPHTQIRTPARTMMSDAEGRFRLPLGGDDTVHALIRRIGFEPMTTTIRRPAPGDTTPVQITLLPVAARLDRVIVEGQAYDRALWDRGFYRRQRGPGGVFFDPEDLRWLRPAGLAAIVREAPRVVIERRGTKDVAYSSLAGRPCRMHVYIDGVHQRAAMPGPSGGEAYALGLHELIDPRLIHAVEVYPTAAQVPTQFARMGSADGGGARIPSPGQPYRVARPSEGPDAPCGAIVIWTNTNAR